LSVFALLFLAAPLISRAFSNDPDAAKSLRVLFIGNSLTYANDLPAIVEAFAKAAGKKDFSYKTIAFPDFSLEDHWNKKDARNAIIKGRWDFVVLQQGPSASREARALLLEYSRRFAEEVRRSGGRVALYSVWPSVSRKHDFNGVSISYRQAAEAVDGIMFPVGDAWLNAWRINSSIGLYSADGFHPSAAGSYLAGLVVYERLFDRSPVGLPSRLKLRSGASIEIPADQAVLLQHAAEEANARDGISISEIRDYRKLFRVNQEPLDMVESTKLMCAPPSLVYGPHYDPGVVYYINEIARQGIKTFSERKLFPVGSIIVKEKQERRTEASVQIITVMKKIRSGRSDDSWVYKMFDTKKWAEIEPSSRESSPSNRTCIDCHRRYNNNDYVSDKGIELLLEKRP
jgi:hypothetical protein